MLVAASLIAVMAAAGVAVDLGRVSVEQNRLQNAVDSAALAGSLQLPDDPDVSTGKVKTAATDNLLANDGAATGIVVESGGATRSVCVTAEAKVEMTLSKVVGIGDQTVTAEACAGSNYLEVVLVIDTTGSMGSPTTSGTPMNETIKASWTLANTIMPKNGTDAVKVGLVPFQGLIRIGQNSDGIQTGCRNADGSITTGALRSDSKGYYNSKYYKYGKGSGDSSGDYSTYAKLLAGIQSLNSCDTNKISPIQELTKDPQTISNALTNLKVEDANWMKHGSGTVVAEGVKWAHNVLKGPDFSQGSSDKKFRKIIILLSDGESYDGYGTSAPYTPNKFWCNAYFGMGLPSTYNGHSFTSANDFRKYYDTELIHEANDAKSAGIEIYSIYYGSNKSTTLMKSIATADGKHFYNAPSTSDLSSTFKLVGSLIGNRLMSRKEATTGTP